MENEIIPFASFELNGPLPAVNQCFQVAADVQQTYEKMKGKSASKN